MLIMYTTKLTMTFPTEMNRYTSNLASRSTFLGFSDCGCQAVYLVRLPVVSGHTAALYGVNVLLLQMSGLVSEQRDQSESQKKCNALMAAILKSNTTDTCGYSHNISAFLDLEIVVYTQ